MKRLVSHGRVRFLVDLSLPPPLRGAPPVSSRLRSSLPEREQAAAQIELTRGKDGHVAALPEAHRPQWEFVVAVHEQEGHVQRGSQPTGNSEREGSDVSMADISGGGGEAEVVEEAETAVSNLGRGGEAGTSQGGTIEGVHAMLRRLQASVIAEGVFDSYLGEAVAHPPAGALVVRASTTELELSLAHGQRLSLYLRRTRIEGIGAQNRAGKKAAEARVFLMEHFIEARYGGQRRVTSESGEDDKKPRRGGDHGGGGVAEAEGGLAGLCRALQQEHAWSIIQHQVEEAVSRRRCLGLGR